MCCCCLNRSAEKGKKDFVEVKSKSKKQKAKSKKKKKKKKRCDEQGGSVAVFKRLSLPLLSLYRLFIVYCILKKTDRARAR